MSALQVVPGRRVAVVALTNGGGGARVADKVVEHVLRRLVGRA